MGAHTPVVVVSSTVCCPFASSLRWLYVSPPSASRPCEQLVRLEDLLEPDMCMHMCMLLGSSLQHVTGKYVAASCCNPGKPLLGGVTMGALRTCAGAS